MQTATIVSAGLIACLLAGAACCQDPATSMSRHIARGEAYLREQKLNEAIIEYRNAVQLDPRSGQARSKLAAAYWQER